MDLFGRHKNDEALKYLEPLGLVLTDWQLARILGKQEKAAQILAGLRATALEPGDLFYEVIGRSAVDKKTTLVSSKNLPILGRVCRVEDRGGSMSYAVGLPSEMKGLISDQKVLDEARQAENHGILALIVLETARSGPSAKWAYVGTLLFEPKVSPKIYTEQARFLSVLPISLLLYYFPLLDATAETAVEASSLLSQSPKEIEKTILTIAVIGSATLRDRYQILSILRSLRPFTYQSLNPQDEQLPNVAGSFSNR